jgi:hypothetical protein
MDILKKSFGRMGKQSESLMVIFKPINCTLTVTKSCTIHLAFKRGPQKEETKPYKVEKPSEGNQMQAI